MPTENIYLKVTIEADDTHVKEDMVRKLLWLLNEDAVFEALSQTNFGLSIFAERLQGVADTFDHMTAVAQTISEVVDRLSSVSGRYIDAVRPTVATMAPDDYGALLERFMSDNELTQSEMAELTTLSQATISRILRGERNVMQSTRDIVSRFMEDYNGQP